MFSHRASSGSRDSDDEDPSSSSEQRRGRRGTKEKKLKKNDVNASNGTTFLERYALWSHRNPLLALTCIVLVAVACILTVVLNDELKFVETNDREWVILKDEITSDADAASEGTRLVEECVLLLHAFRFLFVYSSYLFLHIGLSSPLAVFNELLRFREEKNRRTDIFFLRRTLAHILKTRRQIFIIGRGLRARRRVAKRLSVFPVR